MLKMLNCRTVLCDYKGRTIPFIHSFYSLVIDCDCTFDKDLSEFN